MRKKILIQSFDLVPQKS